MCGGGEIPLHALLCSTCIVQFSESTCIGPSVNCTCTYMICTCKYSAVLEIYM